MKYKMTLKDLMNGFKQDSNGQCYIKVTVTPKPHQVTDTLVQKSSDESQNNNKKRPKVPR